MFGTTYYGCQVCPEKSVLIPCFHDESYFYMDCFKKMYARVRGIIFHSKPEFDLANNLYNLSHVKTSVLGEGVYTDIKCDKNCFVERYNIQDPFIIYAGRKDSGKNIDTLIRYFEEYKKRKETRLKLVLIGGGSVEQSVSIKNEIVDLGFVTNEDKYNACAAAVALCQPSNNESFSLVIMESWLCDRPVIVSGKCEVTKHFASISNGGLYFNNYFEFEGVLDYLLEHTKIASQMGHNGKEFVLRNFQWDVITQKYTDYFRSIIYENENNAISAVQKKSSKENTAKNDATGKKKIALVNQRYGMEVNGGSETLCRQLAEKLSVFYDVEVLTTCALDYMTWDNYYNQGVEYVNSIKTIRFKTDKPRSIKAFNILSERIFNSTHTKQEEENWIDEQGPYCPDFIGYLKENSQTYDVIIFMTYLYYLTARGMELNLDNAILLPTAHDEPPVYLDSYKKVFKSAKGFIYNTDEEKSFVEKMFDVDKIPSVIAGVGVDVPEGFDSVNIRKILGFQEEYIIYVGRIDESKGCKILFDSFIQYKKRNPGTLKLVLIGKAVMPVPKKDDIICLGFINEDVKFAAIKESIALVLASSFESLSMVVLESMTMGRPVLVNGSCSVLKGHCIKSNAGLYFNNYFEFEGALNYLLNNEEIYQQLSFNATDYIKSNYEWENILEKIVNLIEGVIVYAELKG